MQRMERRQWEIDAMQQREIEAMQQWEIEAMQQSEEEALLYNASLNMYPTFLHEMY